MELWNALSYDPSSSGVPRADWMLASFSSGSVLFLILTFLPSAVFPAIVTRCCADVIRRISDQRTLIPYCLRMYLAVDTTQ